MQDLELELVNKKAKFLYHFQQTMEVGIVLQGTEIKSVRARKVSFTDAYCHIKDEELFLEEMHISEYKYGTYNNHEPKRRRKLLAHKREIRRWETKAKQKGFTMVPYRLYLNERGLVKLEIALVSGKKSFDKRDSIKERDNKRVMDRAIKERY